MLFRNPSGQRNSLFALTNSLFAPTRGNNRSVSTAENLSPAARWISIIVIWVAALLAAVAIGIFSKQPEYADWLALALAACTFLAMCVQLATQQKHGFVNRLAASVIGALGVLAIATIVLSVVRIG